MFLGTTGPPDSSLPDRIESCYRQGMLIGEIPCDYRAMERLAGTALWQQSQFNTPESHREAGCETDKETGVMLVSWLRIDNQPELNRALHLEASATDPSIALKAYLKWGTDCVTYIQGDFSFAIFDPRDDSCFLFRDRVGTRPLYYQQTGNSLVFGTSISTMRALGLTANLSEAWLCEQLMSAPGSWEKSPFEEILKVPPGHYLEFRNGVARTKPYFSFSPEVTTTMDTDEDYVAAYQELLRESIRCRTRSSYDLAAECSGGLDSTTVICLAASEIAGHRIRLHTAGFGNTPLEKTCIEATNAYSAPETHRIFTHTDSMSQGIEIHRDLGYPSGRQAYVPLYAHLARTGARTLLSGFGGDEFVTNFGGTCRVEFLHKRELALLMNVFPGRQPRKALQLGKWLADYLRGRHTYTANNLTRTLEQKLARPLVREKYVTRYDLAGRMRRAWSYDRGCRTINDFLLSNRWSPAMTLRMEECSLTAAYHRLEYRWPLMDARLIAHYLSYPPEQKLGPGGISRYLHRRAVAGHIPDLIANKEKAMGVADLPKREHPLSQLPFESLCPELQQFIDPENYEHAMDHAKSSRVRIFNEWLTENG